MSKATPGPWELLSEPGMTIVIAAQEPVIDGKHFGIALIPHGDDANAIPWDVKEANARLIAAAPKLLESLRECLSWMECDCRHPACKRCRATKEACAAIDEAEATSTSASP